MAGKAGSYFSTELGLAEVAFAASGRSICMHCKSKIPIHTVRYSWYHSKVRPPAWCHSRCLFQLIQDSGLKSQAVPKLQALIAQHSENHVHNRLAEDAQSILTSLESLMLWAEFEVENRIAAAAALHFRITYPLYWIQKTCRSMQFVCLHYKWETFGVNRTCWRRIAYIRIISQTQTHRLLNHRLFIFIAVGGSYIRWQKLLIDVDAVDAAIRGSRSWD